MPCNDTLDTITRLQQGGSQGGADWFRGFKVPKTPSSCGILELLRRPCNDREQSRKNSKILKKLSLAGFEGTIMYAKIRAKNWATLYEIDRSKEGKIKSVAQFYLTLMRMPDWKTTVILSSECTSM